MGRAARATDSVIRHAAVLESTLASLHGGTAGPGASTLELAAAQRAATLRGHLDLLSATAARAALDASSPPELRSAALGATDAFAGAMRTTDAVLRGDRPFADLQSVVADTRRGHRLLAGQRFAPTGAERAEHALYADERAAVQTAELARSLRRGQPAALDRTEQILRTGEVQPGGHALIPASGNANGDLPIELLRIDAADDTRRAVLKAPAAQAAQEEFGWRVLRHLGVDYLAPATARRADGTAAIEFIAGGTPFWKLDIRDQGAWDRVLTDSWQHRFPSLSRVEAGRAAIVDRQLVQFADWLTANPDRHVANGIVADHGTTVQVIDHGFIGRGETESVLRPRMKPALLDGSGRIALTRETRDYIARHLTPDDLVELHQTLRADAGKLDSLAAARLAQDASDTSLARMQARLRHAIDSGVLEYEPLDGFAHPLQPDRHPAW